MSKDASAWGLGEAETLVGNRKARPFELGSSAFVGQIRTTRSILAPQDPQSPIRNVVDCWGFGVDAAVNLTESIGIQGELFTGAGLGEYNGGIGQTFDSATRNAIRSSGGWGEVFAYLTPACMSIPATASTRHSEEPAIHSPSLRIKRSSPMSFGTGPRMCKSAIKSTIAQRTIAAPCLMQRAASSIPSFSGSSRTYGAV
jgi:hypothetical protein